MKGKQTHIVSKVLLGVAVMVLFTLQMSPIIYVNGGGKIFEDFGEASTLPLEFYEVEGAGYFLKSCSDFLFFLNKAELAANEGTDYGALKLHLNNAISNMELARGTYFQFKQKADVTPYNAFMIDKLLHFNYNLFQKENGLIKPVFEEVESYLGHGKIREFYGEILCHTEEILTVAYTLKAKIEANEFPDPSSLWDLQHRCCKSMLMGQYASKVFLEINN